jgi:hypothetical protein
MNTDIDTTPTTPSGGASDRTATIKQWRQEAKAWILEHATAFIEATHGGAPQNPAITVIQICNYLDQRAPVPGYELLRADNPLRYQVVRNTVEQAAKDGKFTVSTALNSRGKESKCFSPVGWVPTPRVRRPSFDVLVDGPDAETTSAKLTEWLENNHITIDSLYVEMVRDAERKAG